MSDQNQIELLSNWINAFDHHLLQNENDGVEHRSASLAPKMCWKLGNVSEYRSKAFEVFIFYPLKNGYGSS